ncbi:cbb3-type cytochrome oxidase cytochrome c subunit [Pedobacter sp. UYEF25]
MINKVKKKQESTRAEITEKVGAKTSDEKVISAKDAKKVEAKKESSEKHQRP